MAVTNRGRVETCVMHPDRPAAMRCVACHKPACAQCAVSTADGKFCSHDCARRTADFRSRQPKPPPRGQGLGGVGKLLVYLILLVVALCVVNRYFHKVPVIGDYLWKAPVAEK